VTQEDFDTWLKEPMTKYIFRALRKAQEQEKAEWLRVSWGAGECSPVLLAELRAKAEAFENLLTNEFETWKEWSEYGDRPGD
jgi:hypothetical protein